MTPDSASPPGPFPTRFRRRLTIAFVLVASIAPGLLALGCLSYVSASRLATFQQQSRQQAHLAMALAAPQGAEPLASLVSVTRGERGVEVVGVSGHETVSSRPGLGLAAVPPALRGAQPPGTLRQAPSVFGRVPYLVLSAGLPGGRTLYLFFSEAGLRASLDELGMILLAGWLIIAAVAALVGYWIARQTLLPVRAAAGAARALAGGLLDTRLESGNEDEFGTWAHCFNEMAAALQATIASLAEARDRERAFTSNVAHELRTPLSAIVGAAELVQARLHEMPPGVRRPVELLTESTERLRRLVADLLELSRMDAGGALVHREAVALHETIRGVVRLCGWESGVALALEPICVDTDCRRLERILVNLVSNAVQHGRRGIGVRAAVEGDHAVVEVADDGPGIPEEDLPRIFDRFYKADPARASGGSGLGLAIALENARLLGTEIEVWSRPGEGARFAFRLPLWRREPEPGDRREEREVRVASGTRVRSIPRST